MDTELRCLRVRGGRVGEVGDSLRGIRDMRALPNIESPEPPRASWSRIATPVTCADLTPLLPIGAPLGRRKDDVPVRELEGLCISRLGWLLAEGGSLTLPGELEGWWWELEA